MAEITLAGTNGNDVLNLLGLEYPDFTDFIIKLKRGDDVVRSGFGNDNINSGAGNDSVYGGYGNDIIRAGRGDDYVDAGHGDDYVSAGRGDDTIKAGPGADRIFGANGNDIIYGVKGNNFLNGGSDDDFIDTGVHSSTAIGGTGDDTIRVDLSKGAHHTVQGDAGEDHFEFVKPNDDRTSMTLVADFTLGTDTFEIDGVDHLAFMADLIAGTSAAELSETAGNAEIHLASDDVITLSDVSVDELIDYYDDFVFA